MVELPRIPIGPKPGNQLRVKEGSLKISTNYIFALNVVTVNFLSLKHFFYAKIRTRQNSLFVPIFLNVEIGHFKFCYRKRYKIPPKSDFLFAAWNQVEISGNYQW